MANQEQLKRLKQGVKEWNRWRMQNPHEIFDLSEANIGNADLNHALLIEANLRNANLIKANLSFAYLGDALLIEANLRNANLNQADLRNADLRNANLYNANLYNADLGEANLNQADLRNANLYNANLSYTQILFADLTEAVLTGACIADWQIGTSTKFDGIQCDYIFRAYDSKQKAFTGRLPVDPNGIFKPGEFEQWIAVRQGALDTIDITFTEGIDWQAFFQSFQELRNDRPDEAVSIKAMEREGEAFVVRLEVEAESDKATIETQIKQLYEIQLRSLEAQYEKQLRLQGENHADEIRQVIEAERQEKATLIGVMNTMAKNQGPKYTIHGNIGNLTDTNWGNMIATINRNYGTKADDIIQLLTSLRESAQFFPDEHKAMAELQVEDLTNDVAQPQSNPARLKTRIVSLLGIAISLGTHIATATDFANNVLELSQKLDVPAQALQPQLEQLKQIYPDFNW